MARPLVLLLPPSEGKAAGGRPEGRPGSFDEALGTSRAHVVAELTRVLRTKDIARRSAILGVRGELLERALEASASLASGTAHVLPAWKRYAGVVWAGLEPSSLTPSDRRRILVPSGLYGVTTAADPVADYRLKMSVVLGRIGRLSAFWRHEVTEAVAHRARGRTVVDLLPAEHAAAIDVDALSAATRLIRTRFVSSRGDKAVGHEAKSAKGRLARALLDGGLDAAADFRWEGWKGQIVLDEIVVTAPGG